MTTYKLSERLNRLLGHCVGDYIKSATPIASGNVAASFQFDLENKATARSPASIRNDLKMLEEMGLLKQIHTSGGRVPTTAGYSAYVESTTGSDFAADVINDLYILSQMMDRIDKKLSGEGKFPLQALNYDQIVERRQNIYKMLEVPDLEMSALFLIIKERIDGRKK